MNPNNRDYNIQAVKSEVGWAYSGIKWPTPESAAIAMKERARLLKMLAGNSNSSFQQNKLHRGKLSPGCACCGEGTWSCMFINGLCTASCFFCPQDRTVKQERPPVAEKIIFNNPADYTGYLKEFNFKGIGFSGGESLLAYRTLVSYIENIRNTLGSSVYLWIYTNGDLADKAKLQGLKQAGLDEIRIDIAARSYGLKAVELATQYINAVAVEIPAIPEDFETVKDSLAVMAGTGVKYLNLHQLLATSFNFQALSGRGYTFLHNPPLAILESEITALKLLLFAAENNISLGINYCSQAYKTRLQGRGHRRRAAYRVLNSYEGITDSGYIRKITALGQLDTLQSAVENFKFAGYEEDLWLLDQKSGSLVLHPSLLSGFNPADCSFTVSYFEPYLADVGTVSANPDAGGLKVINGINLQAGQGSGKSVKVKLDTGRMISASRIPVSEYRDLSLPAMEYIKDLFINKVDCRQTLKNFVEKYDISTTEKQQKLAGEKSILRDLEGWEFVPVGFAEIY